LINQFSWAYKLTGFFYQLLTYYILEFGLLILPGTRIKRLKKMRQNRNNKASYEEDLEAK